MELIIDPGFPLFASENFREFRRRLDQARDAQGITRMRLRSIDGFVILETPSSDSCISFPSEWLLRPEFKELLLRDLETFLASIGVLPLEM